MMLKEKKKTDLKNKENAHQNSLGALIRNYPIAKKKLNHWLPLILSIIAILTTIALLTGAFLISWTAVEQHGRAILVRILPLPLILSGFVLPIGVLVIVSVWINWNNAVDLYEKGLMVHQGRKYQTWFWEEIERLDTRVYGTKYTEDDAPSTINIIMEKPNARLKISNKYEDMESLLDEIRQKTLPLLYTHATQKLHKGESIKFHQDIEGVRQGLLIKRKLHNWEILQSLVNTNGQLKIIENTYGRVLFARPVKQFRNLDLLLSLLDAPPVTQSSPR